VAEPALVVVEAPLDQRASPCFTLAPLPRFVVRTQREGSLEAVYLTSIEPNRRHELLAPPGTVVRLEVTLENVGEAELTVPENALANLRSVSIAGARLPVTSPTELRAGQRLAPGAMVRLCVEFDVGRAPLDVSRDDAQREYTFGWLPILLEAGHPLYPGGPVILTRYTTPRGTQREPDSWGGVIRVELAPGASLLAIARETGLQIGSRVRPFVSREFVSREAPAESTLLEAPVHMRVRDAAAALLARPDVIRAAPILRGQPGTEGCSENSPCPRGMVCGYPCGIEGCPHGCMSRDQARVPRP
jgi:hypothetical protein